MNPNDLFAVLASSVRVWFVIGLAVLLAVLAYLPTPRRAPTDCCSECSMYGGHFDWCSQYGGKS